MTPASPKLPSKNRNGFTSSSCASLLKFVYDCASLPCAEEAAVQSIQLSFLRYSQGLEIAPLQKPASKTFILFAAATPKLIFRHSSPERARIFGATSQRVWSELLKTNAQQEQPVQPLCPKCLHRHQHPQFRLAVFFHFSRSFAISNPALVSLLERAHLQLLVTALLLIATRTRHLNRWGFACLLNTPAATSCLQSIHSR